MSLGVWLRAGRTQRGLSVQDVSRITKIQLRILERLEVGKLDGLPADVFVRGFVRSIARCVGLDEAEALTRYAAAAAAAAADGATAQRQSLGRPRLETSVSEALARHARAPVPATPEPVVAEAAPAQVVEPVEAVAAEAVERIHAVPADDVVPATGASSGSEIEREQKTFAPSRKKRKRRESRVARRRQARGTPWQPPVTSSAASIEGPGSIEIDTSPAAPPEVASSSAASPAVPPSEARDADADEVAATADAGELATIANAGEPAMDDPTVPFETFEAFEPFEQPPEPIVLDDKALAEEAELDAAVAMTAPWAPTMPTVVASGPWRRVPGSSAPNVVPSLVIDDADPESAERVLEERAAERQGTQRRSFLPPILLDREDRSARQGGLTLAVIILLIAATLTLSYLMRRPSSSGEGVTMAAPSGQLIG
ncbi:MAG: helix-turn-helix domain-containing protein [Kofleriaceae bacterium]